MACERIFGALSPASTTGLAFFDAAMRCANALGCGWEEALLPASPSAIITWSVGSEAGSLFLGVHVGSPVFLLIEPLDILVSTGIM